MSPVRSAGSRHGALGSLRSLRPVVLTLRGVFPAGAWRSGRRRHRVAHEVEPPHATPTSGTLRPVSQPTRVKDLFLLPESVLKARFVEKLAEAVNEPERVAESYVVTPALAGAFDKGLTMVGRALAEKRSVAAFVHGSFGSGKSHFMAMLHFLSTGEEHAWRHPELHALRAKHAFAGKAKVLTLVFHMVGHTSLVEAIAKRYLAFVRDKHPGAPVPPVFADEALFEDARRMLDTVGEEKFFAPLNAESASGSLGSWGALDAEGRWDRRRFERTIGSSDPAERAELFGALVKTHFVAFAREGQRFLPLDGVLAAISRHASVLGYEGIVLYLDELVLWLASRASDVVWFHNEVQQLVKLVEAEEVRPIPFVSFIARQRDLSKMVGRDFEGSTNALVRDSFQWSEGRYETITLEDRNLVEIAEKRVLRVKDEAARRTLDESFDRMRKGASEPAWRAMLGTYEPAEFRKLYPFSPALVHALVGLSNALQRERTAIRLLTEVLVEHAEDLAIGDIVGVGDLFDVLAGGEDTADGPMKARFDAARQLYRHRLLPVIQAKHGTTTAERCQRMRPGHPVHIGCSGCREKGCRTDNRLLKTLVIAALVPEVEPLKGLTASRVVALNHGSLRTPIPGTEGAAAAQRLRDYASNLECLHVGDAVAGDPTVHIELESVDVRPILSAHQAHDTLGQRQRVLRQLLFSRLGLSDEESARGEPEAEHKTEWRGTTRRGTVRFANVRKMPHEQLVCSDADDYRIVVDFPFDEPEFYPLHDEEAVRKFREETGGSWTLVWLPTFFSQATKDLLGDYVILEHLLGSTDRRKQAVAHLATEQQVRALQDLENLRTQKQSRLRQALEQAYGLASPDETTLDLQHAAERSLHLLKPGADTLEPRLAPGLAQALEAYARAVLDKRYPRHATFGRKVTPHAVREGAQLFAEVVDTDERRIVTSKQRVELAEELLAPLGLVRVVEGGAVHLVEDRVLRFLENERHRRGLERPTVYEMREILDESRQMGLPLLIEDLIVRCFARQQGRELVSLDRPFEGDAGKPLPGDVVLERPDLPTQEAWSLARVRSAELFGYTSAKTLLGAENLRALEKAVTGAVDEVLPAARALPERIEEAMRSLAPGSSTQGGALRSDRLVTARSGAALVEALRGKRGRALIEALASAKLETSATAVRESLRTAKDVTHSLGDALVTRPLERAAQRQNDTLKLSAIVEAVAKALTRDELHGPLVPEMHKLAREAFDELEPKVEAKKVGLFDPPTSGEQRPGSDQKTAGGHVEVGKLAASAPIRIQASRSRASAFDARRALDDVRVALDKLDLATSAGRVVRIEVVIEDEGDDRG